MYLSLFSITAVTVVMAGLMYHSQRELWREFIHAWNEKERVDGDYAPRHREVFRYHRHRFRRRTHVSILMGIVGVLLPIAWHYTQTSPSFGAVLWFLVIFLLVWMIALGIVDAVSTYFYYLHVRDDLLVERTKLEAQQRRMEKLLEEEGPEEELKQ